MADEGYDPEAFTVRVSPGLFRLLAGRASEPGTIEPRNQREANLIAAVRREEQKRYRMMQRSSASDGKRKAASDPKSEQSGVLLEIADLREKLHEAAPKPVEPVERPCAEHRAAVVECYRKYGSSDSRKCSTTVDKFVQCARRLVSRS